MMRFIHPPPGAARMTRKCFAVLATFLLAAQIAGAQTPSTALLVLNKDNSKIFTANIGSDSISLFERGANPLAWNHTVVPVGKGPEGIDLSPDEKEIWTAHSRDGGVSIVDVTAKKVVQTLDLHTK